MPLFAMGNYNECSELLKFELSKSYGEIIKILTNLLRMITLLPLIWSYNYI